MDIRQSQQIILIGIITSNTLNDDFIAELAQLVIEVSLHQRVIQGAANLNLIIHAACKWYVHLCRLQHIFHTGISGGNGKMNPTLTQKAHNTIYFPAVVIITFNYKVLYANSTESTNGLAMKPLIWLIKENTITGCKGSSQYRVIQGSLQFPPKIT